MRLRDVIDTESKPGKSFALLAERGAHAVRGFAFARGRHQFERHILENEDCSRRAVALRAPLRGTAEQRLITGDTRLDVANEKYGVIQSGNHGARES